MKQLVVVVAASGALMVIDHNTTWLKPLRWLIGTALVPFEFVARTPLAVALDIEELIAVHDRLEQLEVENSQQQSALLRYQAVAQENETLRALLHSRARVSRQPLLAELIGESDEPEEVILDKGTGHGVRVGQPVIDANGVFGQITEATAFTSRVLLIADPTHAVPVYVLRSEARAIAVGDGAGNLTLKFAPATLDVREGDQLLCSGLGGRFPFGYPVGTVTATSRTAAEPFLDATVVPKAALYRSRQVLVLLDAQADDTLMRDTMLADGDEGERAHAPAVDEELPAPRRDAPRSANGVAINTDLAGNGSTAAATANDSDEASPGASEGSNLADPARQVGETSDANGTLDAVFGSVPSNTGATVVAEMPANDTVAYSDGNAALVAPPETPSDELPGRVDVTDVNELPGNGSAAAEAGTTATSETSPDNTPALSSSEPATARDPEAPSETAAREREGLAPRMRDERVEGG